MLRLAKYCVPVCEKIEVEMNKVRRGSGLTALKVSTPAVLHQLITTSIIYCRFDQYCHWPAHLEHRD